MTDHRDGNVSNRYDPDPLTTDTTGNMLDFDYSSVLDKDYSKDLEQKIFVDGTESDLLGEMSGTDRLGSSLYTGSPGNISDYLYEKKYEIPDTSIQENLPFSQENFYSQKVEPTDSGVSTYQDTVAQRADQGAAKETMHTDSAQSAPKASDHPSVLESYFKQKKAKASDPQSTPHPTPAYTQSTPQPAQQNPLPSNSGSLNKGTAGSIITSKKDNGSSDNENPESQEKKKRVSEIKRWIVILILFFIVMAALVVLQIRGKPHRTISDSWEEIIVAGEDGTYIDKYQIGDTKELDLGEEGVIEMELVAFDTDELADGSGKAHMTWIAKDLLNTEHFMNEEDTNEGGWPASDMRAWLRDSILPLFPETVRSNIREVKKYSNFYSDKGTISSSDTIWIPSVREIFGADEAFEDEGPEYLTAFQDDASRQKQHIGVSEPSVWWLRSSSYNGDYNFIGVSSGGSRWYYPSATDVGGVVVGFCIGSSSSFSSIESGDDDHVRGTISDSWEEIIAAGEDGTYVDKYKIGDTKELDLGEEGVIEMELVAFDTDELADGSGKAAMTWIAKGLLNTEHRMNAGWTNEGGWPASDMRAWLRESILPLFPETVRSNIREVKKYSYSYSDKGTISSSDTIWIPSGREMFGADNAYEDEGPEYLTAFPDDASRQKQHIGVSEPSRWWLRSASNYYDNYFSRVNDDGSVWNFSIAYDDYGVVVGFCF